MHDRELHRNIQHKEIEFLRSSDWQTFTDEWTHWGRPYYVAAQNYLNSLPEVELADAARSFEEFKEKYLKYRSKVIDEKRRLDAVAYERQVAKLHDQYLRSKGSPLQHIRRAKSKLREAHCWSCHHPISSIANFECSGCGWIICDVCGACEITACGHSRENIAPLIDSGVSAAEGTSDGISVFDSFAEALSHAKRNPGTKVVRIDRTLWRVVERVDPR